MQGFSVSEEGVVDSKFVATFDVGLLISCVLHSAFSLSIFLGLILCRLRLLLPRILRWLHSPLHHLSLVVDQRSLKRSVYIFDEFLQQTFSCV